MTNFFEVLATYLRELAETDPPAFDARRKELSGIVDSASDYRTGSQVLSAILEVMRDQAEGDGELTRLAELRDERMRALLDLPEDSPEGPIAALNALLQNQTLFAPKPTPDEIAEDALALDQPTPPAKQTPAANRGDA
ncbi:MAG: hypothetical protein SFX72_15380 [Isosphaeraceae bacterium]|nr:hypothetical protein [Isosphaeraceae bacterium]